MEPERRQAALMAEAKLANELARRLIAGHPPQWRPERVGSPGVAPLVRALRAGEITPDQARTLLVLALGEVNDDAAPLAGPDGLIAQLSSRLTESGIAEGRSRGLGQRAA
jgi:hypothetical protein